MQVPPFKQTDSRQPRNFYPSPSPDNARRGQQSHYNPVGTLQTSTDQLILQQKNLEKQFKSNALDRMAKEEYQPAIYAKALNYRNERSYRKKIDNEYREIDLLANTDELRYFGLGPYFYIELFRRICWLLFFMSVVQALTIYINYKGAGLTNYSVSYFSYLIKASLGNYSGSVLTDNSDGYIVCLAPAVNYLAIFFFYLIWKVHYYRAIAVQEEDNKDVKPEKFCIEINGLSEDYADERDLQRFFSAFGPVYEVSVVRYYENQLGYFEDLDQLQEQIKEEELELMLGGDQSNRNEIAKKRQEKQKLEKKLLDMNIRPRTVSVFVHFQFEKSKVECLNYFNEHYLFDNCPHSCTRNCCCCCISKPDERAIFKNQILMVTNQRPPTPADINWEYFQLTCCSKFVRVLFAFLIILAFLALSTTIIGICGIYISSHSNNCDGVNTSSYTATTAAATGDSTILRCFCNANLIASFTDDTIKTTCKDYLRDIYVQQAIQYVVLITEVITNILFGVIVDKLVNCVRPESKASGLFMKTLILTVFLLINTILVPVLIYADIFGFQPTQYVSFLTIISKDIEKFLLVSNLSFYPSFNSIWYRNVSPIFVNYVIFNTLGVWGSYLFFKCCCSSRDSLQDEERKILQKTMNRKINSFQLDIVKEASNAYLILFMTTLFCAGIPALVPLALVNLLSRYLVNRSLLQSYSSKVQGLGQDFSSLSLIIFPIMLIFFPLIGEWMLISNSAIYPSGLPSKLNFLGFLEGHFAELDKQAYLPFYLLISFVTLCEVIIYNSIIRFCSCLCNLCYEKKQVNYHTRPFSEYTKSINVLCSYNIRNNDHMRNAILHLEKYLIAKQ